jgi:hypothetical protein
MAAAAQEVIMTIRLARLFPIVALACLLSAARPAWAGPIFTALLPNGNIGITVDENCTGTINGFLGLQPLPCSFVADPGPGGLPSVMTYDMVNPPGLVTGDVEILDPLSGISDLIRFNSGQRFANGDLGALLFYSDNTDGVDRPADVGLPTAFNTNFLVFTEVGNEVNNGLVYIPTAGQPGFVAGASAPIQYTFISDGAGPVPEPTTLALLGGGLMAGLVKRIRRRA